MKWGGAAVAAVIVGALAAPASAQEKSTPYWASVASGKAMTRTGPGRNYPGVWLYQRRDLPVRVLKVYENWRLIEDPEGQSLFFLTLSQRRIQCAPPKTLKKHSIDIRHISVKRDMSFFSPYPKYEPLLGRAFKIHENQGS